MAQNERDAFVAIAGLKSIAWIILTTLQKTGQFDEDAMLVSLRASFENLHPEVLEFVRLSIGAKLPAPSLKVVARND